MAIHRYHSQRGEGISTSPALPPKKRKRFPLEFKKVVEGERADLSKRVVTPLIPSSPPQPKDRKEIFVEGCHHYREAEVQSDQEDRRRGFERALDTFSNVHSPEDIYYQKKQYMQGLCLLGLAQNQLDALEEWRFFEEAESSFQAIQDSKHPYFLDFRFWEGYSSCKLKKFEKGVVSLSKIPRDHPYFQEAQFWKGICLFELAKDELDPKESLIEAKQCFSAITDLENVYYSEAKKWLQSCLDPRSLLK